MFEKIEIFDKRYSELSERLYQPSVAGNPEEYQKIMKEIKSIEEIVLTYRKYKEAVQTEKDSLEILEETSDKELKELAQIELDEAKDNIKNLAEDLKIMLLPKDPNDERNVIVEIRGGAGGEESALFSAVLFRMYSMYAEKKGFKIETGFPHGVDFSTFSPEFSTDFSRRKPAFSRFFLHFFAEAVENPVETVENPFSFPQFPTPAFGPFCPKNASQKAPPQGSRTGVTNPCFLRYQRSRSRPRPFCRQPEHSPWYRGALHPQQTRPSSSGS